MYDKGLEGQPYIHCTHANVTSGDLKKLLMEYGGLEHRRCFEGEEGHSINGVEKRTQEHSFHISNYHLLLDQSMCPRRHRACPRRQQTLCRFLTPMIRVELVGAVMTAVSLYACTWSLSQFDQISQGSLYAPSDHIRIHFTPGYESHFGLRAQMASQTTESRRLEFSIPDGLVQRQTTGVD